MKRLFLYLGLVAFSYTTQAQSYVDEIAAFRHKYKRDFLTDARSPLKAADTPFLKFYAPDPAYRVTASFHITADSMPFMIPTHSGKKKSYRQYGVINFSIHDTALTLHVYQSTDLVKDPKYKDELFIPFTDATNNVETFGGGRYIDLSITDIIDGKLVLDFNKCYNPYCAFADGYSCPLPPKENELPVAIKAGEQLYGKKTEE